MPPKFDDKICLPLPILQVNSLPQRPKNISPVPPGNLTVSSEGILWLSIGHEKGASPAYKTLPTSASKSFTTFITMASFIQFEM